MSAHAFKTWWARNGSTVLFVGSQICAIVAPILAANAAPKAAKSVEEYKAEHLENYIKETDDVDLENYKAPGKIELAKAGCYNSYIPSAGIALAGVAMGGVSYSKQKKTEKAWINAYNMASSTTNYLTDAIKENVSKDKFNKIKSEAAKKELENTDTKKLQASTDDLTKLSWFKDAWSGQIFRANIEDIRQVRNDINEILNNDGRAPLNEWYVHLINVGCEGLSLVELGWAVGWEASVPYQNLEVDIDVTQLSDGTPCGLITFRPKPRSF